MSKLPTPGSRIPGSGGRASQGGALPDCCVQKMPCCKSGGAAATGASGIARPGSSGIARPGSSGIARPGSSGIARPGSSGIARPGSSGIARPGSGIATAGSRGIQPPGSGIGRPSGIGRGTSLGTSRIGTPGGISRIDPITKSMEAPAAGATKLGASKIGKASLGGKKSSTLSSGKPKKESLLKKFDKSVTQELNRRRDHTNVLVEATTSDVKLLEAVDHLARAETLHAFAGAVRAAEQAAANAPPELAEEAAVEGAKGFQAEIIDIVQEHVPGLKPIQVIGYVGITKPKKPLR